MNRIPLIITYAFLLAISSCKNGEDKTSNPELAFSERLEKVSDSIKVNDITVLNLFKNQILAHNKSKYDSIRIIEKVYYPHKELWDNCYGMIFGEDNASKFNTSKGIVAWNKTLYLENKDFFDKKTAELLKINLDSVLKENLSRFGDLVPYKPKARISILFTPLQGIGFGGCSSEQFCIELNNTDYDIAYTVEKGIPHELNHFVYEPLRKKDPSQGTALYLTIDEGFACYFTWLFFDKKITKYEVVEEMTEMDWDWFINNEKQIFNSLKPYFQDTSGDNPLLRNDTHKLFPTAPKSLYYWLGFRIVESYVETHGEDSWRDIYRLNVQEVLDKSGYERYINELK